MPTFFISAQKRPNLMRYKTKTGGYKDNCEMRSRCINVKAEATNRKKMRTYIVKYIMLNKCVHNNFILFVNELGTFALM